MGDTSITLTDSGYRQVPTTGTETEKANAGAAITLKSVTMSLDMTTLLNDEATKQFVNDDDTKEFTFGEADKGGINLPMWTIEGVLDMDNATDQGTLGDLVHCVKTKGFKKIGTTADATSTVMLRYTGTSAVTSINVRIRSFTSKQSAESNKVVYKIILVETA